MGIGNGKLTHVYFLKHSCMGTARMKEDKETDEEGKTRGVSVERSKAGTKERSHNGLSLPNQNTIIINIICHYFIRYQKSSKKFINKKQNGQSSTLPGYIIINNNGSPKQAPN